MNDTGWTRVSVTAHGDHDGLAAAFFSAGVSALQQDGAELIGYVRGRRETERLIAVLRTLAGDAAIRSDPIEELDWAHEWKRALRVQRVGRLSVAPPWMAEGLDPRETIVIDPGMAFGTGDHASTRGALRQLVSTIKVGDRVVDLGAGSAILSIGAAKCGAARVAAVEVDSDAIGNAEANIAANDVQSCVRVIEGDAHTMLPLLAPADLIVANILSGVIVSLLHTMHVSLASGGRAVVAGIMESERNDVIDHLRAERWRISHEDCEAGWWCATIVAA